jgi:hypothetical protein
MTGRLMSPGWYGTQTTARVAIVMTAFDLKKDEAGPLQRSDHRPRPQDRQLAAHAAGIWISMIVAPSPALVARGTGRGRPVSRSTSR